MPSPLSVTRMDEPPFSRSTVTSVAPASRAFSSSSLTMDAGLSTTSPAAMQLVSVSGRMTILPDNFLPPYAVQIPLWVFHIHQKKSLRRRGETCPSAILRRQDLSRFLPIAFSPAAIDQRADDGSDHIA